MKKLSFISLIIAVLTSSCSSIATVGIPPQQEFVLGEQQNSGFRVQLKNLSKYNIEIRAVSKSDGVQTQGFGLDGKSSAKVTVNRREKVIIRNPNESEVKVRANISKTVEGMRYQNIEK